MKVIKSKLAKLAPFFKSAMVVLIASLFVMSIVYASTTIGSSITTGGNLTVSGWASTTNATTTGYLYIGGDLTEPPGWNWGVGDLIVADDAFIKGTATATDALWVGTGTADNLNLASGDLYVQDDLQVDSVIYLENSETIGNSVNGLIELGGNASTTGDLYVSGGTFDLTTSTATSTTGVFARNNAVATSTVSIGDITDGATKGKVGCLEIAATTGAYYNCYIDPAAGSSTALICVPGRCN